MEHNILLIKLEKYAINGIALRRFCDYLSNKAKFVTYNNHVLTTEKITCFISLLPHIVCRWHQYAHCWKIFFDVPCDQMNEDLQAIQGWLNCNKLSLNVLKTHYMIFLPRNKKPFSLEMYVMYISDEIATNHSWILNIYIYIYIYIQLSITAQAVLLGGMLGGISPSIQQGHGLQARDLSLSLIVVEWGWDALMYLN